MTSTGRRVRGQTEAQRLAARELRHSELLLNKRISHLIDFGLYRFVQTTDREVLTFRRRMVGLRWRALAQRAGRHLHEGADGSSSATHASPRIHPADYMTEPFLDTLPFDLEPHIAQGSSPALAVTDATDTAPRRAVIRLNVMVGSVNRAVLAQVDETVDQLITNNVLKFWRKLSLPEDSTCDDYVLKLAGSADYLGGPHPLLSFEAIRRAVSRRESIVVRLLPKGDLLTQDSQWTENWDLIEDTVGRAGTHQQLSSLDRAPEDIRTLSLWDLHQPLRVRVLGLDNLSAALAAGAAAAAAADKSLPALEQVYVEAALYHGGELLGITSAAGDDELAVREAATRRSVRRTTFAAVGSQLSGPGGPGLGHIRWDSWLTFGVRLQDLPRATRLCLTVYGRAGSGTGSGTAIPLGWVNFLLMDSAGQLAQGVIGGLHLWPSEAANPIGCCVPNPCPDAAKRFTLYLQLDEYSVPVMHPDELPGLDLAPKTGDISPEGTEAATLAMGDGPKPAPVPEAIEQPAPAELAILERVRQMDPLSKLDPGTKRLVWRHRRFLRQRYPDALPKLLLSAPWDRQADVAEARELVANWPRLEPEAALELLDANFADAHVRAFAVAHLAHLDNAVLVDFLVQLIQVLKYEPYHDSALARFLLRRALASRRVGHHFFWHLRAEMHWPEIQVRFALYLETYLRGAGSYLRHLERQSNVIGHLARAALAIKPAKNSERRAILHRHLADLAPGVMGAGMEAPFELSLNPRWEASGVLVDRCKFMGSKKLPLWLVFENADAPHGPPHHVIFKSGDDLRQDMLTLQMIGLMDKMWKRHGLDLRMLPYGCISLGDQVGMIEVVLNAETVSDIQFMYGGSTAAFRETPIADWLRGLHKNEEDYMKAVDNFTLSCAGYCVATYILGIGDRHNDNIMVTTSGQLFHIDYGHFLGNIKRKFGWKRERAPFVLTPDFVYLMETKCPNEFERFQDLCVQAYLIVRRDARLFLNLFAMMLSTGIPELKHADDIGYLRDALCLDLSPEEAAAEFRSLISESLRLGWSTQLNWLIHNLVHQR
ncbi:hypothetical protein H696_01050 [Fonticula alba]|uniref:phosphatidylinositol 3-kinase n=1 Tax=Fonticula alba TaxID=691883 RepID=A0A058ZDU1_FONAL|nr:hypothetical protein H696_01050 [Fonticula alba]KCV71632.1 hypothetical protein H696_01050 [Fonticula alba]|eukprot:XP_009493210.1 hypothetical protein H696_01050 [Fonticula alba]